jgi:hypothetical protein
MRIFKTKWFARYARQERIADMALHEAAARAERGLVDADLGGGVIKQRVARQGKGRSGGYRTIIAFRREARAIFVFAFAKNERENIDARELEALKMIAAKWLTADEAQIDKAVADEELREI